MRMSLLLMSTLLFGCSPAVEPESGDPDADGVTGPGLQDDGETASPQAGQSAPDANDGLGARIIVPDTRFQGLRPPQVRSRPANPAWWNCEGFLTNNPAAGFCEDEPPENWEPFEYEGRQYYFVPLSG